MDRDRRCQLHQASRAERAGWYALGRWVSISARDQARIAEWMRSGGRHRDEQIVSTQWLRSYDRTCAIAPFYGWLTWLNRDGRNFPGASTQASFMIGAGGHYVWIEPAHDAVVVGALAGFSPCAGLHRADRRSPQQALTRSCSAVLSSPSAASRC